MTTYKMKPKKVCNQCGKKISRKNDFCLSCKKIHLIKTIPNVNSNNFYSKQCCTCYQVKDLTEFGKNSNSCKECLKISEMKSKNKIIFLEGEGQECKQSLDFKTWDKFCYCENANNKKSLYCTDCLSLNYKLRLQTDINVKLSHYLRNRIRKVLKNNIKSTKTSKLLDCSIDFLKKYLESKFKFGMTWDNYGKNGWEIDHIRPCASFDLSKPEEQCKCFHYSNLQPLWVSENRQKSNKII